MTKRKVTLRSLSTSRINQWAEDGDEFEAGSMSGAPGWSSSGRLDSDWSALYNSQAREISYTIFSYSTPIAWRTPSGWVIVTQTFSTTTGARHQPHVRYLQPQRDPWCPGSGQDAINPGRLDERLVKDGGRYVGRCPECGATVTSRAGKAVQHIGLPASVRS